MSTTTWTDRDPFTMTLRAPATVGPGGLITLTGENLPLPEAGAIGSDSIANQSGVAGATVSAALDQLDTDVGTAQADATQALADAGAAQDDATDALTATSIYIPIADIISASAETGGLDGYAGTITSISIVPNADPAVGDLVVTFSIGATPITGGAVTATAGSGALVRSAVAPSADNVLANNDVLSWAVSGGNTAAGRATVRVVIDTTTP